MDMSKCFWRKMDEEMKDRIKSVIRDSFEQTMKEKQFMLVIN